MEKNKYQEGDIVKVEIEGIVLSVNEEGFYRVEISVDRSPVEILSENEIIEKIN